MLFNVLERRFIIFGQVFWPQDFHLLVLSIIALLVFIILFTVNFGRIFCGWVCPQTIFMEFVFRQIEYLIEGNYNKQRRLDRRPANFEKILKKGIKHIAFFAVATLIINIILAYIVGEKKLGSFISEGPSAHLGIFAIVVLFSGVFYMVYAFFREQVCIIVCPYGRLQGVLLDERSIVVSYDYRRGEPRAPFKPLEKRSGTNKGDCIDCKSCVAVCPTGIDIRNGTQLECVNCTACIDACNHVMDRIRLPRGLVRYDSEKGISEGRRQLFSSRSLAYTAILAILLIILGSLIITRDDVETTILRLPGSQFQQYGSDSYSNIYRIQLINKTRNDIPVEMSLNSHKGEIVYIGNELKADAGKLSEAIFMVVINEKQLRTSNTPISIGIISGERQVAVYKTNFLGPGELDLR